MGRLTKWVNGEVWYYTKDDHYPAREMEGFESLIAMNKLAHYEDLEEAGRLIELKCAIGDICWCIDGDEDNKPPIEYKSHSKPLACLITDLWGTKFFATKEEAEAKLKELEGEGAGHEE